MTQAAVAKVPIVELRDVHKGFGGAQALSGVDLHVMAGEVHCLVGENGAGKSTLGKIVAGVITPDHGEMLVAGRRAHYRAPRDALRDGIAIVEQELALVPAMTVGENALLGLRAPRRAARGAAGVGRAPRGRNEVRRLIAEFGLDLDPDQVVDSLNVSAQQKVEILRALLRGTKLIVLDEPTARLAREEIDNLLGVVRRLAASGTAIVYVSHFLDEVLAVADHITVLRNGRLAKSVPAAGQTAAGLIESMLGVRTALEFPPKRRPEASAPVVLALEGVSSSRVRELSLDVREGEIVGLAGLVGSGRTESARLAFGADRYEHGRVLVDGSALRPVSIHDAIRRGVALVPEDRKGLGLFLGLSNQDNVTLPHLSQVCSAGLLSRRKQRAAAADMLKRLRVTPPNTRTRTGALSGGNQQKVMFAKWLWQRPRLLIVDEPTRGVDVGAKFAIYDLLVRLAAEGMAILIISSELEEIVGLCHRVIVMARGAGVAQLSGDDVTESRILNSAFASAAPARER